MILDIDGNLENDVENLSKFLNEWDHNYMNEIQKISLFNHDLTSNLSENQKTYFVKLFYHARGHFHDFLWYMGNFAPNKTVKIIILKNILEEFGEDKLSHEQLYLNFSKSMNVDISDELVKEENYLGFIKEFNKGHLEWLRKNDWDSCFCAFSAYERLDNVDYNNLLSLVKNFNSDADLIFFNVHAKVMHFETTLDSILDIYKRSPEKVEKSFKFIADHQIDMWDKLSNEIFDHA